jgi:F-type H+-transporting ATPase subunit b
VEFFLKQIQNAEVWVAIGLLIFVGVLIAAKVPAMAMAALDARGIKIKAELDEAVRLREEASGLLNQIKAQRLETEKLAAEILASAHTEAERLRAEAKTKLAESIKRRQELAERKIAIAEAQAAADVKAAAADLAAQIAEQVLTTRVKSLKSDPLVDAAVSQLAGRFS